MFTHLTTNNFLDVSFAHWLVIVSALISLSGAFAYIRDMLGGKTKPNLVTWGLWALAPMLATGAAISARADLWATGRIFMSGFGPLLITITALFVSQSYWKLSLFDYLCGFLSLIALGVWLLSGSPVYAILLLALADLFATLPTIIKAWRYPSTETAYTYLVGLFSASIIIPAIPVWNIQNSAFQIYLVIANTCLFLTVFRKYILKPKSPLL